MPKLRLLFLTCLLPFAVLCASAQTTIRVPADQPTIQAGINAAKNGDTVLVSPGTYYENIDFKGKAITLTSTDGAAKTILDGQSLKPAVTFNTGENRSSILSGFTVQNGGSENYSSSYGYGSPGIFIGSAGPTITNDILTHNHCWTIQSSGAPLIQNNQIDNTQDSHGDCSFAGGAAIWLDGSSSPASQPGLTPVILGNIIENNTLSGQEDAGGNGGAGVASWTNNAVIENNIIRNNATHGKGGAVLFESSSGLLVQNLIYNNRAGGGGGGFASDGNLGAPMAVVANNTFYNNTYGGGGGSSDDYPAAQLALGYFTGYGPSIVLVNNIVAGGSTEVAISCDTYVPEGRGDWFLADHNLFLNTGGPLFKNCADPTGTYGNISADPQFVNPATGDFHLLPGSPAIDAGNNSVVGFVASQPIHSYYSTLSPSITLDKDLDGNLRTTDFKGKGFPVIDLGAYEAAGIKDASATSLLLTPSYYSNPAGQPLTVAVQALSAAGTPTGPVTLNIDGNSIGTASLDTAGKTSFSNPGLKPGVHRLVASYPGQGAFIPADSIETVLVIDKYSTAVTITSSANPSVVGQSVTFSVHATSSDATYIPTPIQLNDSSTNTTLATLTPDASGNASFSTNSLAVGFHYITANYAGDTMHSGSSAYVSQQVVNPYVTSTTVSGTPNSSIVNAPVSITATVTSSGGGTPTGTVNFTYGATALGSATLNPGSSSNSATATISTSALPVGFDSVTASYVPTGSFGASSGSYSQQVLSGYRTSSNLSSSLNPSSINKSVTFTAHITSANGTPTGSVSFTDGSSVIGSQPLDASGTALFTTSNLSAGSHTITATYISTGSFTGSNASLIQQVSGLPTTSTLVVATSGPYNGNPVSLTATVASTSPGTPTGTVTFYADGYALAGPLAVANGTAMLTTSSMRPGTHALTCAYSGDSTFSGSNCPAVSLVLSSLPTSMTLASSANPSPALSPVTFTANLTSRGKPYSNTVLFYVNGTFLKAVPTDANGNATVTAPFATGSYVVNAQFPGNDGTDASYAAITQVAVPNPTTTTLAPPAGPIYQNQPATFAINVAALTGTSSPNGSVALYEGTTLLGQTATQPSASGTVLVTVHIPATLLSGGTHSLSAVYTPDVNFLASSSTPLSITVAPQTFTLSLSSPSMSVQVEHHIAFSASVQSVGGFTGPVQLSCTPPPDIYFTCDVAASRLQLAANGTATSEFVLDTDAVLRFKSSLESAPHRTAPGTVPTLALASLLPLSLLGFARRRKGRGPLPTLLALAFLAATACCFTGCSSKYPAHTPAGTYDIPITAMGTSAGSTAAVTQTVHLIVTVTP